MNPFSMRPFGSLPNEACLLQAPLEVADFGGHAKGYHRRYRERTRGPGERRDFGRGVAPPAGGTPAWGAPAARRPKAEHGGPCGDARRGGSYA